MGNKLSVAMEKKTKEQVLEETLSPMYMPEIKMAGHAYKQIIEAMDIWSQQQNQEQLGILKEIKEIVSYVWNADLVHNEEMEERIQTVLGKYDQLTKK